jgi:hypothetical protein
MDPVLPSLSGSPDSLRGMKTHEMPEGFYAELGKVAHFGAQLEETVYMMSDALSLRVRGKPVGGVLDECASRVREHGVPPWCDPSVSVQEVLLWIGRARTALNNRNIVIHSRRYFVTRGGAVVVREPQTKKPHGVGRDVPTTVKRLVGIGSHLVSAQVDGTRLMYASLAPAPNGARVVIPPSEVADGAGYRGDWRSLVEIRVKTRSWALGDGRMPR